MRTPLCDQPLEIELEWIDDHVGEIGSVVLWPQAVQAAAPVPVLAAGGIGSGAQIAAALALGCQGVWTGSLWLTVEEASLSPQHVA